MASNEHVPTSEHFWDAHRVLCKDYSIINRTNELMCNKCGKIIDLKGDVIFHPIDNDGNKIHLYCKHIFSEHFFGNMARSERLVLATPLKQDSCDTNYPKITALEENSSIDDIFFSLIKK